MDNWPVKENEEQLYPDYSFCKVVIIEDNPIDLMILQLRLQRMGIQPVAFTDFETAYQQLPSVQPNLIFLDHILPRINHKEILALCLAHPAIRHIPIIIVSADTDRDVQTEALQGGASAYIAKPVTESSLQNILEQFATRR